MFSFLKMKRLLRFSFTEKVFFYMKSFYLKYFVLINILSSDCWDTCATILDFFMWKFKQDRSRRCQYIQWIDMFFFFNFDIFCHFYRKWRIQSNKYHDIRDQQVNFSRNRHLTCLVSKTLFLAAIFNFFLKRGSPYWRKLPTDLADFR